MVPRNACHRKSIGAGLGACLCVAIAPAAALAADGGTWGAGTEEGKAASGGRVFGRVKAEYRYENAHLESGRDSDDHDGFLSATVGTEKLLLENLETRFSARFSRDLDDGPSESSGRNEWIDLRDVRYASDTLLFPTQAYARLTDLGGLFDVTAGRQYAQEVEWAHFDGVAVASDRKAGNPWSAGAFIGRRVDFWRTLEHQLVTGGHVGWRLGEVDLAASDVYLVRNSFEAKATTSMEGLIGGFAGMAQANVRLIDERLDVTRCLLNPHQDEWGTDVTFIYEHKFDTGHKTFNFDYVSIDGDIDRLNFTTIAAYDRLEGKVWQRLFEPLGVFAGIDMLWLVHESEADGFNASYYAPSGGLDLTGFPARGTYASAKVTYSDFHRPPVRSDQPFDDLQGTGEEHWLEILVEARQDIARTVVVGLEYVYSEFDVQTRFADVGRVSANSYRLYGKVKPVQGLAIRVDVFCAEDLSNIYEDDLDRAEGVWVSVEYSF